MTHRRLGPDRFRRLSLFVCETEVPLPPTQDKGTRRSCLHGRVLALDTGLDTPLPSGLFGPQTPRVRDIPSPPSPGVRWGSSLSDPGSVCPVQGQSVSNSCPCSFSSVCGSESRSNIYISTRGPPPLSASSPRL